MKTISNSEVKALQNTPGVQWHEGMDYDDITKLPLDRYASRYWAEAESMVFWDYPYMEYYCIGKKALEELNLWKT